MTSKTGVPEIDSYLFERRLLGEGFQYIMGLDEVGRGCLAGPVVASGVILDPEHVIPDIADSKTLRSDKREYLAENIKQHARCWTVAWCDNTEIDATNILMASLNAMAQCVEKASVQPDFLLIDGNKGIDTLLVRSETIVGGDTKSASIGAASILAKVYRDRFMAELHGSYPEFGWDKNVGYPTRKHYEALSRYGYTPYHRLSFRLRTQQPYRKDGYR